MEPADSQKAGATGKASLETDEPQAPSTMSRGRSVKNLLALGLCFVLMFTSYQGLSAIQSSFNSSGGLGAAGLAVTYASVVASSLALAPLIIGRLGPKRTMAVSMCGYLAYLGANLYPTWGTIIPASVLIGICCAPLWAGMSVYVVRLTREFARAGPGGDGDEARQRSVVSVFFGVFFTMFASSNIWGNLISYLALSDFQQQQQATEAFGSTGSNLSCGHRFCSASAGIADGDGGGVERPPMYKVWWAGTVLHNDGLLPGQRGAVRPGAAAAGGPDRLGLGAAAGVAGAAARQHRGDAAPHGRLAAGAAALPHRQCRPEPIVHCQRFHRGFRGVQQRNRRSGPRDDVLRGRPRAVRSALRTGRGAARQGSGAAGSRVQPAQHGDRRPAVAGAAGARCLFLLLRLRLGLRGHRVEFADERHLRRVLRRQNGRGLLGLPVLRVAGLHSGLLLQQAALHQPEAGRHAGRRVRRLPDARRQRGGGQADAAGPSGRPAVKPKELKEQLMDSC